MSSDGTTLRHNALVYESTDEYLARAVPFLKAGIEAGEGAVVAHTKPGLAMMREALGAEAAQVTFVDVSAAYTRPARTLAAYHNVYVEQLRKTPTLRAVADVQFGPDPNEWDLWTGYEAVFNRSFGHLPAWVLCSYDANGTPDPIIEGVWQTHPEVVTDGSWNRSDHYEDPDHLLRRITPAPAPLTGLRPIPFGRGAEELREQLVRELAADKISEAQSLDLLLAAIYGLPKKNNPGLILLHFLFLIESFLIGQQRVRRFFIIPGKPGAVEIIFLVLCALLDGDRELVEENG